MNIFKNRPLALGCAVFLFSLAALYYENTLTSLIILCVGILLSCALLFLNKFLYCSRTRNLTVYLIPIIIAFLLSSILSLSVFQRDKAKSDELLDTSGTYTVIIEDEEYESSYRSAYIGVIEELDIKVVIGTYGGKLDIGQIIEAELKLEPLDNGKYGSGAAGRYLEDGILIGAECEDFYVIEEGAYSASSIFRVINKSLVNRFEGMVNSDTSAVVSALFLGNREGLSSSDSRDFARLGISHILALSGMHLSIIASMTSGMLSGMGFGKKSKYILTIIVIAGFICLTGFSSSVMRAGMMLAIFYMMFFFKQKADFITRILLAVSIICIVFPYLVFSTSLLLSFFAMLGCAISSHLMSKRHKAGKLRVVVGAIITTVIVNLITLPIAFLKFDFISAVSPLANLIFIPLFTVLLYLSPVLLAFGYLPIIGEGVVWICESLTSVILYLTRNISLTRDIAIPFNSKVHPYAVVVIFLSLIMLMAIERRRAYIPMVSLVVGVSLFVCGSLYTANDLSKNCYISTEGTDDGDVTYIRSDGRISIVDCYPTSRSVSAEIHGRVADMGYCEIENYILVDYSSYASGSLDYITSNIVVRNVLLPAPVDEYEIFLYIEIYENLTEKGVCVSAIEEITELGSLKLYMSPTEFLKRSEKRLTVFSVEGETSRYTYVGASVYEGITACAFADSYIASSDAVYFGIYGPKYRVRYDFDLSNVDYCMFSYAAHYYSRCDTEGVRTVLHGRTFVLK